MKSELTKAQLQLTRRKYLNSVEAFYFFFCCFPTVAGYLSKHSHAPLPRIHHQSAASLFFIVKLNFRNKNMFELKKYGGVLLI